MKTHELFLDRKKGFTFSLRARAPPERPLDIKKLIGCEHIIRYDDLFENTSEPTTWYQPYTQPLWISQSPVQNNNYVHESLEVALLDKAPLVEFLAQQIERYYDDMREEFFNIIELHMWLTRSQWEQVQTTEDNNHSDDISDVRSEIYKTLY